MRKESEKKEGKERKKKKKKGEGLAKGLYFYVCLSVCPMCVCVWKRGSPIGGVERGRRERTIITSDKIWSLLPLAVGRSLA